MPSMNQGNALRGVAPELTPGMGPRNYAVSPGSFMGSTYPAVHGVQYPIAYPGGIMTNRPLSGSPGSAISATANSPSAASSSVSTSSGSQVEGCEVFYCMFCLFLATIHFSIPLQIFVPSFLNVMFCIFAF